MFGAQLGSFTYKVISRKCNWTLQNVGHYYPCPTESGGLIDVMIWKRFPHYWPCVAWVNHSPLDFLKGLVMRGYDVLLWTWAGHRADCRVADDLQYKMPRILTLKCFFSRLDVAFAQSNETRYQVENEDAVGTAPTGDLSDQQLYCLLSCDLY